MCFYFAISVVIATYFFYTICFLSYNFSWQIRGLLDTVVFYFVYTIYCMFIKFHILKFMLDDFFFF